MLGRARKLERLGLAEQVFPASWTLKHGLEQTLRDLSMRSEIIKTMHKALTDRATSRMMPGMLCMAMVPPNLYSDASWREGCMTS